MAENTIKLVMLHYCVKMKLLNIIVVFGVFLSFSEDVSGICKKDKTKKKLHQAENYFDKGDYLNAMKLFNELLEKEPDSEYYHYHLGVCKFFIIQHRNEALSHFEKSNEKADAEIFYYKGMLYHLKGEFTKAEENFKKYLDIEIRTYDDSYVKQLIAEIAYAKSFLEKPVAAEVMNLGNSVNTTNSEYVPLINAAGTKMFFTSRRTGSTGGKKDVYGQYYEDIYFTELKNGEWGLPQQLTAPVNTETHDACVGLTPEGENLLIFRTNAALTSGDIYLTESDGVKWSNPVLLDEIINSKDWNEPSACFSPDGGTIYFTSNRPGGLGGKDIYRAVKLPGGKWSEPMNLGPNINTPFDDDAPFVHSNGKELYFSSKGRENMGGYDVFKSVIDSNGIWQKAENMGSPINSLDNDIYLVLTADGQTGFFSSSREDGIGETDLYTFRFTSADPGYLVSEGFVKDENGNPVNAKITVIETDIMKIHGIYKSNRLTGKFIYLHCEDHDYEIVAEAEGYFSKTVYVNGDEFNSIDITLNRNK